MIPTIAGPSWNAGRLFGIPIALHWSLGLLLALRTLQALFYVSFPYSLIWIGVAVAIAGSILFHELAHALVARNRGYHTSRIELHAFGGLAYVGNGGMRDRDQMWVSAAGPLSNLLLWLVFLGAGEVLGGHTYLGYAAREVGWFNLALGLFNMLPAYPLDGGSVLHAWLCQRAPHSQASWLAFTIGRWVAAPMAVIGLLTSSILLALVGYIAFQLCTARLESVGAVGGAQYWKARLFRRGPGKLDIDWSKYSPQRPPTLMERVRRLFSRGSGQRDTPRRTPVHVHPDEPDDRPPTIN